MQGSKTLKSFWWYMGILSLLLLAVFGLVNWYASQNTTRQVLVTTVSENSNAFPGLISSALGDPCGSPTIYLTFPPKCKTLTGQFSPLPGAVSALLGLSEGQRLPKR